MDFFVIFVPWVTLNNFYVNNLLLSRSLILWLHWSWHLITFQGSMKSENLYLESDWMILDDFGLFLTISEPWVTQKTLEQVEHHSGIPNAIISNHFHHLITFQRSMKRQNSIQGQIGWFWTILGFFWSFSSPDWLKKNRKGEKLL